MLRDAGKDWSQDNASRLGAALAYYSIFSMGPLLLISLAIASAVFGQQAVANELSVKLQSFIGNKGADALLGLLSSAKEKEIDGLAGAVGAGTLVFAATGVIVQLKDAFNEIWDAEFLSRTASH